MHRVRQAECRDQDVDVAQRFDVGEHVLQIVEIAAFVSVRAWLRDDVREDPLRQDAEAGKVAFAQLLHGAFTHACLPGDPACDCLRVRKLSKGSRGLFVAWRGWHSAPSKAKIGSECGQLIVH